MELHNLHPWPTSTEEARALQRTLAAQVVRQNYAPESPRFVAGVDISPEDSHGMAQGAVVLLAFPELTPVEVRVAQGKPTLPYIPGLLAFREVPIVLGALARLAITPDVILVDGQGLAHPRRFGIACHIGLITDVPTVGCAKSLLRGACGPLAAPSGSWAELVDKGEVVGAALRTRAQGAPVYVSIGHKVDLPTAVRLVLACCKGYRLPEPTRLAHLAAAGRLAEVAPRPGGGVPIQPGLPFTEP
ncbi:MAG: deoxyribonuclease V [Chloroflexi bacterium]|nr:deoxyribonuclease V [Chloroflexota bacterium]